jgi:CDP-2,3-bis-(O-geranylgeranyl)-sn-glycerol synthase
VQVNSIENASDRFFWTVIEINLIVLLLMANGSPVIMSLFLRRDWQWPLDGGVRLPDGKRLFGSSKTIPGLAVAVATTTLGAMLIGPSIWIGFSIGAIAMVGDLISSFVKRRFGFMDGESVVGLDQIPESLLPLLVCKPLLGLSWFQVFLLTAAFFFVNLLISRMMRRFGLMKHTK